MKIKNKFMIYACTITGRIKSIERERNCFIAFRSVVCISFSNHFCIPENDF